VIVTVVVVGDDLLPVGVVTLEWSVEDVGELFVVVVVVVVAEVGDVACEISFAEDDVGNIVGTPSVGKLVGAGSVGNAVGGTNVGDSVGYSVGDVGAASVGKRVGGYSGSLVGLAVGSPGVGATDPPAVGAVSVGKGVGAGSVGKCVGMKGSCVGSAVGW